ncbi:MAG: cupin domain-containing protein [Promethearchaeota archaeon]
MDKLNNLSESELFPKGVKLPKDHFTGMAWLSMLVEDDRIFNCPIGNVSFEPSARTNWHIHQGGQILLVTAGKGYYQEKGKKVQVIHKGDVVKIPSGVNHWHGASPDEWLVHIAVMPNSQKGPVEWLEPVTNEEYNVISE